MPSRQIAMENINSITTQKKIAYVKKCLVEYKKKTGHGRGICAVQVGIPERISVVFYRKELLTIINPIITKRAKTLNEYPEICMSTFPIVTPLIRSSWVEFSYFD